MNKAQQNGSKVQAITGFVMTAMGGFVAALNLVTMFPNPEYAASWGKVVFATALAVFGGMVLYKSNKRDFANSMQSSDNIVENIGK